MVQPVEPPPTSARYVHGTACTSGTQHFPNTNSETVVNFFYFCNASLCFGSYLVNLAIGQISLTERLFCLLCKKDKGWLPGFFSVMYVLNSCQALQASY